MVYGSAYRLPVGYPVITKEGNDMIRGHLVELKSSDLLIQLLDQFYGYNIQDPSKSLYVRESIMVFPENEMSSVQAETYIGNLEKMPKNITYIPGGDWLSSLKQKPALSQTLTEKQKSYILKLGTSSGRDIVPIDLALYRELMNLELIVDKGRRLALSKLGVEVYKHIQ